MRPAHFPGDDLVAVWVVDVLLEQLHVAFGFAILLLKKPLPIVLVPSRLWLIKIIRHTRPLSSLGHPCKPFTAQGLETQLATSRIDIVSLFAPDRGIDTAPLQSS